MKILFLYIISPYPKPSLTTSNLELVSNLKNVMDENSVPPTIPSLSANYPTIGTLSDCLSQKEMETFHSSIDSSSHLNFICMQKFKYIGVSSKYRK